MDRRLTHTFSFWAALVIALALFGWGLARVYQPPPCTAGNALAADGHELYDQAEKAYLEVLQQDPASACAAEGLRWIQQQRCFLAQGTTDAEQKKAALAAESKDGGPICLEEGGAAPGPRPANNGGLVASFDDLAWILLVLGAALLVRQIRVFLIRRRPGPIEVTELVDATGLAEDTVQTAALTARMRERLSATDVLPPAPVPGGQLQQSLVTAVSANPLGEASVIGKVLQFLPQLVWAKNGHVVSGTLRMGTYAPKYGVTIQVTDAGSGAPEKVATFWSDSHHNAVRDAAFFAYKQVISHPDVLAGTPVWRHWNHPNGTGASHFAGGCWEEELGHLDKAIEQYREAVDLEPRNAVVRLRLAVLLESQGKVLDALEQYLNLVLHWPDLLVPSYRLAALYASQALADDWASEKHKPRLERLRQLVNQVEIAPVPTEASIDATRLHRYFLDRSVRRWGRLTYEKGISGERIRKRSFRAAAKVAGTVARLQRAIERRAQGTPPDTKEQFWEEYEHQLIIARFGTRWRPDWVARYNLACFYGRAASIRADDASAGWKDDCTRYAIEQLDKVIRDKRCKLNLSWTCKDPDLGPLRDTDAFKAWIGQLRCSPDADAPTRDELQALIAAWEIVARWAEKPIAAWEQRLNEVDNWNGVQFHDLSAWCALERRSWSRLLHWAWDSADEERRGEFWIAVAKASGTDEPGLPDLPDVPARQNQDPPTARELAELQLLWASLRAFVLAIERCWEAREEAALAELPSEVEEIRGWCLHARDAWQALQDWASDPFDGLALNEFEGRARTCG